MEGSDLTESQVWLYGVLASLIAGSATGIGALPVLIFKKTPSHRVMDMLLSFAAGVMLAATVFSLIIPAMEAGGILITIVGIIAGAVVIELLDHILPHEHFQKGLEGHQATVLRKIWLFVIAITLHNFPEGMAVGVGYGAGSIAVGTSLAVAIGLQNIPEGTAVAASFIKAGYTRGRSAWYSFLTGLVEPIGGLIGATAVVIARPALPFFLAFAAGAMLYVISDEIIPETHSHGYEAVSTFSLIAGFLIMMVLDNIFG
ncbi:MAG: zinc transporter, family [Thermotogota bacterium]|nr:zinc transporter, family [Thermotogota bacterium]MDK2864907.1 zinc transporter, family [Thermotogota bacterium]HCZ06288.1 ZIP family metal transporter [Thermotogota bacterium]